MLQRHRPEMSERETRRTIAEVIDNHLNRLGKSQDELDSELSIKLNEFGLLKETFFQGRNFIMNRGLKVAHQAHKVQERKFAGQPYIVHSLRVALLSIDLAQAIGEPVTSELVLGALMHDSIEDSPKFGENEEGGTVFTRDKVKELFGTWSLTGLRAEAIAADSEAFNHNTAKEYGILNDTLYFAKLKHWRKEVFGRRQIIKAADRIDNLLDPITLPGGLVHPISKKAEKLSKKRTTYVHETRDRYRILRLLLPDNSFLGRAVQTATNVSEQTLQNEDLTPENWHEYLNYDTIVDNLIGEIYEAYDKDPHQFLIKEPVA
jgi:HD domain-containing protein